MGVVFARSVMGIGHARMMDGMHDQSGRWPMTLMAFGRLMVAGNVTHVASKNGKGPERLFRPTSPGKVRVQQYAHDNPIRDERANTVT